jgi:hypothetical protein
LCCLLASKTLQAQLQLTRYWGTRMMGPLEETEICFVCFLGRHVGGSDLSSLTGE